MPARSQVRTLIDLLAAILAVFAVLACHWLGLLVIRTAFNGTLRRLAPRGKWGEDVSLGVGIFSLVAWLFIDVAFCAWIISMNGGDANFSASFLFAIANFTTVGADAPTSAPIWNLAGPLTAMCGIFIFGWTTSFLVDCARTVSDFRRTTEKPPRITNR